MWHSIVELLQSLSKRKAKVTCARKGSRGVCRKGHVYVDASLVDSTVYIVTRKEMEELKRKSESLDAMRRFFISLMNTEKGRKMFTIVSSLRDVEPGNGLPA